MITPQPLPTYANDALAAIPTEALLDLLAQDEDRVPRNVIETCAQRGASFVADLERMLAQHDWHGDASSGEWWRLLHAAMILGHMPDSAAGLLLVRHMRRMSEADDANLQDWLAGYWPALFRNKPDDVLTAVRAVAGDRTLNTYVRANAMNAMVAMAQQRGPAALEHMLDQLAGAVQDETDEEDYRLLCANTLLDFPRPRHRALLEASTRAQENHQWGAIFLMDSVTKAYAAGHDQPRRDTLRNDPWQFYEPQAIAARQQRWAEEDHAAQARATLATDRYADENTGKDYADTEPYARESPKTGRNDRCPCGSGKKYKHCCLKKDTTPHPDDLAWQRLRRALNGLPKAMLRTAHAHFGAGAIDEAWAEFNLWDGDEVFDLESPYAQVFLPWYLYDWLPDPEETTVPAGAQTETAAAAHLRIAVRRLDPLARGYIEACIATPFSFHEIITCNPGRGFRLRDVLLGTEEDAIEHAGSLHAQSGDLIYAKVVRSDGLTLIEGCTSVLIPPIYKTEVIAFREQISAQDVAWDDRLLREYDFELREVYLDIADRLLNPQLPEMTNTDGDPFEFRELVFDIDSPQAAFDALKGLAADVSEDELRHEAVFDTAGALVRAEITWRRAGSNTIFGALRIDGRRLTAQVNSARRADELRRLIEAHLGAGGRYRINTVQSVESLLSREPTPAEQTTARERASENARLAALPEVQATIAAHLREHYRKWLDEAIPLLCGRTPRAAVREPAGREAVAALILQLERNGVRMQPPLDPAIIRELRGALGL